ncbi:MAG: LysE family translocator, partial [Pseudomonadota bacterium]
KSVFFSAAVLLVIFPPVLTPVQSGVIFLNHLAVEAAVQSSLVYVLSGTAIKARYLSLKSRLDRLAALVLGALGLRLLLSSAER